MRLRSLGLGLAVAALVATPVAAQQPAPPPGCTAAENAQFDFWVGSWTVRTEDGGLLGRSTIEKASRGCAVLESWVDGNGVDGHSINFYDPGTGSWHQVWMGANGSPLRLQGGIERPGRMVMTGARETTQGTLHSRITWTRGDDGTVEQLWESSTDGGATWQTGFLGVYHRES